MFLWQLVQGLGLNGFGVICGSLKKGGPLVTPAVHREDDGGAHQGLNRGSVLRNLRIALRVLVESVQTLNPEP